MRHTGRRGERAPSFEGASAHAWIAHATDPANPSAVSFSRTVVVSSSLSLSPCLLSRLSRILSPLCARSGPVFSRHRHAPPSRPPAPTSLRRSFNWREILLIELLRVREPKKDERERERGTFRALSTIQWIPIGMFNRIIQMPRTLAWFTIMPPKVQIPFSDKAYEEF